MDVQSAYYTPLRMQRTWTLSEAQAAISIINERFPSLQSFIRHKAVTETAYREPASTFWLVKSGILYEYVIIVDSNEMGLLVKGTSPLFPSWPQQGHKPAVGKYIQEVVDGPPVVWSCEVGLGRPTPGCNQLLLYIRKEWTLGPDDWHEGEEQKTPTSSFLTTEYTPQESNQPGDNRRKLRENHVIVVQHVTRSNGAIISRLQSGGDLVLKVQNGRVLAPKRIVVVSHSVRGERIDEIQESPDSVVSLVADDSWDVFYTVQIWPDADELALRKTTTYAPNDTPSNSPSNSESEGRTPRSEDEKNRTAEGSVRSSGGESEDGTTDSSYSPSDSSQES